MNPKRLGFQVFDVHFGMFDYSVHVVIGPFDNLEKYARWKHENPDIVLPPNCRGLNIRTKGRAPILWLPSKPRAPHEIATLAHEMLHVVHSIMDWAGVPLTHDSDEVYCHALGHGVDAVLERLK